MTIKGSPAVIERESMLLLLRCSYARRCNRSSSTLQQEYRATGRQICMKCEVEVEMKSIQTTEWQRWADLNPSWRLPALASVSLLYCISAFTRSLNVANLRMHSFSVLHFLGMTHSELHRRSLPSELCSLSRWLSLVTDLRAAHSSRNETRNTEYAQRSASLRL